MPKEKRPIVSKQSTTCFRKTAGTSTVMHQTGYINVRHVVSGLVKVECDGATFELYPGDTLIVNPFDTVTLRYMRDTASYDFVYDAPRFFDDIGIPALTRFSTVIKQDSTIRDICFRVNEEYEKQTVMHEKMLFSLITELTIRLFRLYRTNSFTGDRSTLGKQRIAREALGYIHDNCTRGLSTSDISEHVNVSAAYLCRIFKEVIGQTPLDYAERIRLRLAHEDLSLGTYTVSEIALKYAYTSVSYFNRQYKKYIGVTPGTTVIAAKERRRKKEESLFRGDS